MNIDLHDTIAAIATPAGQGALGIIRVSGPLSFPVVDQIFIGANLLKADGHTIHFGKIMDGDQLLDEVLVLLFRAPASYTGEDIIEISCHGSSYILREIMQLLIRNGMRPAQPGEFTMRSFLNGKQDLTQAEAVADLIASGSQSQHEIAVNQMRGGFSRMIQELRAQLIEFASLIELENDFAEEDVEFADRTQLINLVGNTLKAIESMKDSFSLGNALKEGIPVAIIGKPNVGKSTLLNTLLQEDKAIISEIAGTTRDVIEDTLNIEGITFRIIDTAGIRETKDTIEGLGIQRSYDQLQKARIVLYIDEIVEDHKSIVESFQSIEFSTEQDVIILLNKTDDFHACHQYDVEEAVSTLTDRTITIAISAKEQTGIAQLKKELVQIVHDDKKQSGDILVSNIRHYNSLLQTAESLTKVKEGFEQGLSSDLIAMDIRYALHSLGEITGVISTDDLLEKIFRDFCIGK